MLAQGLKFGALAFEVGFADFNATLEFALEFEVELAAFSDELASDKVAFLEFAGHGGAMAAVNRLGGWG